MKTSIGIGIDESEGGESKKKDKKMKKRCNFTEALVKLALANAIGEPAENADGSINHKSLFNKHDWCDI